MTRRSVAPPSPDQHGQQFVDVALRIISREAVPRTAVRLLLAVGGGWELWKLDDEPRLLAKRPVSSAALAAAARDLTRGCVSQLDVQAKSWLLEQMDGGSEELLPGVTPNHFRIALDLEGESCWELRVTAHARGGSVLVAQLLGVLEPVHQAAT